MNLFDYSNVYKSKDYFLRVVGSELCNCRGNLFLILKSKKCNTLIWGRFVHTGVKFNSIGLEAQLRNWIFSPNTSQHIPESRYWFPVRSGWTRETSHLNINDNIAGASIFSCILFIYTNIVMLCNSAS